MANYKKDFPIFENNPDLIFFDSGASSQKPKYVIDGVSKFVENDYANIHRGFYSLSERSEDLYHQSKKIVAEFLNCSASEVFYTYNSTYGINIIAWSLGISGYFKKGDSILVGIWEHHANVVPRQNIAEDYGLEVRFINIDENFDIDRKDFDSKYDETTKLVAIGHVSNVTGQIYDIKKIKSKLRSDTFFIIDGSQSIPHFAVDVQDIDCDAYAFTGHKVMSYTGIGTIYLKKNWIKSLKCIFSGGGAIENVTKDGCTFPSNTEKFEMGTPNIIGAVSLLKAFEYIKKIGGYEVIKKYEDELISYTLKKFESLKNKIILIGSNSPKNRVGVFSFIVKDGPNINEIGEKLAQKNICIRAGGHCAYPLHQELNIKGTCRMSLYIYNDKNDIDKFFEALDEII